MPLTGEHGIAQIIIQMFYRCATNFYGSSCATYCQERDDETGHYSCASDGSRECLNGYTDPMTNCTNPEDGGKTGQDSHNLRNQMEHTTIGVQDIEPTRRATSESAEEAELLSVADILVIVNIGMLDVLLLMGLVLLAVTIAKMTRRHRRSKQGTCKSFICMHSIHAMWGEFGKLR